MHVTTPLNELITSLAMLGWEFKGLKTKSGQFIASAKNPQTGQDIERTGNSPEMAVHAVFQYAERAANIRAFAGQKPIPLLQYGEKNGQDWKAQKEEETSFSSFPIAKKAAEGSLGEEVDYWWPEWEHIDDISRRTVVPHQGYRDSGLVEGAVGNARSAHSYGQHDDIFHTAADIIAKMQRQQAIVEGNKRTATAVGLHFLQENNYDVSRVADEPYWSELVEAIWLISDAANPLGEEAIERVAQVLREACASGQTKESAWGERTVPNIHVFSDQYDDTGWVYNMTQTDESIKDGDVLVVPKEEVVGVMVSAWPTAVTEYTGEFHDINPEYSGEGSQIPIESSAAEAWKQLEGGKYWNSYQRAVGEAEKLGWKLAATDDPIDLGPSTGPSFYAPPPTPAYAPIVEKEEEKEPVTAALGEAEDEPLYVPENIMDIPKEEISDVDNPMGWRVLVVKEHEDTVGLFSPTYHAFWPFGKAIEADREPEQHGNWGINVVEESKIQILEGYKSEPWVQVKVVTGGKVWPFRDGWRAQFALPYEIKVPANVTWYGRWSSDEISNMLRKNYLCDAQVVDLRAEDYPIAGWSYKSEEVPLADGWQYQILSEGGGRYGGGTRTILVIDDQQQIRAQITGTSSSGELSLESITTGNNQQQLSPINDDEAVDAVIEVFESLKTIKGMTIDWKSDADQGRDQDEPESWIDWDNQETRPVESIEELVKIWQDVQQNSSEFTEYSTGDGYNDVEWVQESESAGGPVLDDFGLPLWIMRYTEYPPTHIDLDVEKWRNIMQEAVGIIANDNFDGQHIDEQMIDELAQAMYGVPAFLASGDIGQSNFDGKALRQFFDQEIEWGLQYASELLNASRMTQEESLFPTDQYGQSVGLGMHPKLNRFFNLLRYYVDNGETQRGAQGGQPGYQWTQWEDPETPEWGSREMPAIPGAISSWRLGKRNPDYLFVYYKSELRVEDWDINLKHPEMLRQLFDEFGRDMNNEIFDIETDEVAAGAIYEFGDDDYWVDHEQMNDPEIRKYAENQIEQWFKSKRKVIVE